MDAKNNQLLFLVGFFGLLFFFLLDYPSNYFTVWSIAEKILLSLITLFAVVPFLAFLAIIFLKGNYLETVL